MRILIREDIFYKNTLILEKLEYAAGVLPIAKTTGRILIQKRAPNISHGNTWATFGGKPDANETPEQTARREFKEESGYDGPIYKMAPSFLYKRKGGFKFYNNLILVPKEFKVKTINKKTVDGEIEVVDAKWVSLDELKQMNKLHFGLKSLLKHSEGQIKRYIKNNCKSLVKEQEEEDEKEDISIFSDQLIGKKFNSVSDIWKFVRKLLSNHERKYGIRPNNNFYDYFEIGKDENNAYYIKVNEVDVLKPDEWGKIDIIEPKPGLLRQTAESNYSGDYKIIGPKLVKIGDYIDSFEYLNHSERIIKLGGTIIKNRRFEPIIVNPKEKYVIEGQHRIRALKMKGFTTVLAYLIEEIE